VAVGPSACNYDRDLAELLSDDALNEYFFRQITDPGWLIVLVAAGKFSSVPTSKQNQSEGTIAFPPWPQGEFLKRIVGTVPDDVSKIVAQLPPTQNARVHDSVLELAMALPPDLVVQLVSKVAEGIRSPYHLALGTKIGPFISSVARSGRGAPALELAEAAFEILDRRSNTDGASIPRDSGNLREPGSRLGLWEYGEALRVCLPDLVHAGWEQTFELLCNLLDRAILFSDRRGSEMRPNDFSHVWRPAIEDHNQNSNMGVKNVLVSGVREAAIRIAQESPIRVEDLVRRLENRGESWTVFRRIALHLLKLFPEAAPQLLRQRLLDRELFSSMEMRHEYFQLEEACFGHLDQTDQEVILDWIDKGPSYTAEYIQTWEKFSGKAWTDDDYLALSAHWKRDRLTPLSKYLVGSRKDLYDRFLSDLGSAEHPEFTSYHQGGAYGPQSPRLRDDLEKLSTRELVSYLSDWKPTDESMFGPKPEGLGREISAIVAKNPAQYAIDAAQFEMLSEPTYIRSALQGFQDALKQKKFFSWPPVLDLCIWAMGQRREIVGRVGGLFDMDPDWGWTRAAVCRLLTTSLSTEDNPLNFSDRDKVWRGIEPGTHDTDPTREQEERYWKDAAAIVETKDSGRVSKFDPLTNAINTPRGVAMEAAIQYALWVRRQLTETVHQSILDRGFDLMPEVRSVLDFHLVPENDPSMSIRSIYGERYPWLQLLDENWARANTSKIFPRENGQLWHAAWDTFVAYSMPYDKTFEWLSDEYRFAVEQIGAHGHGWGTPEGPSPRSGKE